MSETERPASRQAPPSSRHAASSPTFWSRSVRGLAWLVGIALAGAASVVVLAAVALAVAYPNLPEIGGLTDYRPKLPMRVYSSDGVLLGEYGEERRSFLPIREIPKVMQDAVLAIEDARF